MNQKPDRVFATDAERLQKMKTSVTTAAGAGDEDATAL